MPEMPIAAWSACDSRCKGSSVPQSCHPDTQMLLLHQIACLSALNLYQPIKACHVKQQQPTKLECLSAHMLAAPQVFQAWQAISRRKSFHRTALQQALAKLTNTTLLLSFTAWKDTTRRRCQNRTALQQALCRLTNQTLFGAFTSWKEYAVEHASHKAKIGTSLQRLTNRTLFAAFATWREWASHKAELQGKLQGAVGRLWHGQLAAAWQAWREHAQYSIDVKARMKVSMQILCLNHTTSAIEEQCLLRSD